MATWENSFDAMDPTALRYLLTGATLLITQRGPTIVGEGVAGYIDQSPSRRKVISKIDGVNPLRRLCQIRLALVGLPFTLR